MAKRGQVAALTAPRPSSMHPLKRLVLSIALPACLLPAASAQRTDGYVFVAPGGVNGVDGAGSTLHFGGGGELGLPGGLGLGGELGALSPRGKVLSSIGIASANAFFHFGSKGKVDPYVTGGYSLFFRSATGNGGNLGIGVNLWLLRSLGLKLEFRDHVVSSGGVTNHWWGGRIGLNF